MSTPAGNFDNCMHIRLQHPDNIVFDWLLAPGVGFVQFGVGPTAYVLSSPPTIIAAPPQPLSPPSPPAPRGNRILGLGVNTAGDNDYLKAISLAKSAGVQTVSLTIHWDAIETAPGTYDARPACPGKLLPAQEQL